MKKAIRNVVIGATCATMLFAMTGCQEEEGEHFDTENRPVALAIGALDQNFNPFFYTSGNDGEIIGLTQISMLTSDADGNIVCGDDQATLVRDYTIKMYDSANQEITGGDVDHTTYEFVIKNGVKDSTGHTMDIKDVLFNLYVYLDPLYSGSATIYSTKIQGLAAYRAQQLGVDDNFDYEAEYRGKAQDRFDKILNYDSTDATVTFGEVKDDVQTVARLFKEGLEKDWTSVVGTVNSYSEEYRFTEDWEVYLLNEGMIGYQYFMNSFKKKERLKDANGKYYTTLDPKQPTATTDTMENEGFRTLMESALNGLSGKEREEKMKQTAVDLVFSKYFIEADGEEAGIYDGYGSGMLTEILTGWSVSGDIMNEFLRDEMSKNSNVGADGELNVKSISGITTRTASEFNGVNLGGNHDILSITINGVDPAAIYNFAFTVAPMHYYSSAELVAYAEANWNDPTKSNRFGVKWQDNDFMTNVIGAAEKRSAPVGAGAYKMKEGERFYDGSIVRYERNDNFTTLGSGIENAKIKYLNYVYTTDDQIINSLKNQDIDYGQPNCTPKNVQQIQGTSYLNMRNYVTNGFGYVGINPTKVPDREVRLAIMLAMNPQYYIINNYYTTDYSSEIFRPTSTTNFLNRHDKTGSLKTPYVSTLGKTNGIEYKWTDNSAAIASLVESAGWTVSGGKYTKNGKTLTLTFTIAGETQDHPAWQMFTKAAEQLNAIGFDITVKNDRNALISLATGNLAVWAAAWSTGIDPDMYQIYHKDSKASSTKNWGYDTIMNNSTIYDEENELLTHLSAEIDLARSSTREEYRTIHYVNALNDVMEMAVELPTYQRYDLAVYNNTVIKASSLNQNPSANAGLLFKIWELDYN